MPSRDITEFIDSWTTAPASERSNSQRFLLELCAQLEVPPPDIHPHADYDFEHAVTEHHRDGSTSTGLIDLHKHACFVLEPKQFQEAQDASEFERDDDLRNARREVDALHERLCTLRVLYPVCNTGNFLYLALQHLKMLEGEVLYFAAYFGEVRRAFPGEAASANSSFGPKPTRHP